MDSVGNIAHTHFAANVFSLPLKTAEHPRGVYTEHELYMVLSVLFVGIFFDLDPVKSFPLRKAARAVTQQLGKLVEMNVQSVSMTGWIAGVIDGLREEENALRDYGVHMIRRLLDSGMGVSEATWSQIVPTAGAMVANQAQVVRVQTRSDAAGTAHHLQFTQILDYYLTEEGNIHLREINRLAKMDTPEADDKILHYAMEGIRLNGTFGSYRECKVPTTVDDGGRPVRVHPGDKVFVSFVDANREDQFFPDPDQVRIDRPMENYIHYGVGPHACLGGDASRVALTAMLKTVGRLDNLRRAPGPSGQLKKIPRPGGFYIYMRADHGSYWPFPTSEYFPP
jgi:linoleate 10R-lipoxygenase